MKRLRRRPELNMQKHDEPLLIELSKQIEQDGFALAPSAIDAKTVTALVDAIDRVASAPGVRQRSRHIYAIRNLLQNVPAIRALANTHPVRSTVESLVGLQVVAVRGLFFDKTTRANWKVAWHQDLTIAVQRKRHVPGFGPWSMKAGVQHVQPPVAVLEQMLTLRIHLDPSDESNGPLHVIPGSHRHGRLNAKAIREWTMRNTPRPCLVPKGGILIMRPLLLHASSQTLRPVHRRVIHLEFAAQSLPGRLRWFESS